MKLLSCALGFVALTMFALQPAIAQTPSATEIMKGSYVFTEQGSLNSASPYTGLGMVVLDGQGGASGWQNIQTAGPC